MVKRASIAAIIWFLAFFVVSIILLRSLWVTSDEPSSEVIFDNKVFYDTEQTAFSDGVVSISGTLTGEGVGNKRRKVTTSIYCK